MPRRRQASTVAHTRSRAGRLLPALLLCLACSTATALQVSPATGIREAPRQVEASMSLDQAIALAERRYKARVVRAEASNYKGRRVYVLRLLSEEGRVWTVRVDASSGAMM